VLNQTVVQINMINKNYLLSSLIWFITDFLDNCQGKIELVSAEKKIFFFTGNHKKEFFSVKFVARKCDFYRLVAD
jgi:hypothetical protein